MLNQEEDPLVSKRKNTADEFELTMSQKKKIKNSYGWNWRETINFFGRYN